MIRSCLPGRMRLSGFTLIEVLVVVAIIAVLIAILIPSLARVREQSKRTVCASNQRQISSATAMYATAHRGWLPHSVPGFNASLTWIVWQEFAGPPFPPRGWVHLGLLYGGRQLREPKLFYCPSYREFPHVYPAGWTDFSAGGGIERVATAYTYMLNGQVDMHPEGARMEARPENLKVRDALHSCVFLGKIDKRQRKDVWPHASGINAAYVDGSVQLVNLSPALARTSQELYEQNVIREMDYFTFCFFRMLSGDRKWINAFPGGPAL